MRIIALLPLCLLLSACQTTGSLDENSPFDLPPTGSRLVLKQELIIPAHTAGVSLQGGRVVSDKNVNQYHPHCRLEVHDVRETTQTVMPDEFVVRRAYQDSQSAALPGLMKAGLRVSTGAEGSRYFYFRTTFDLRSERQPQVRWLVCQQWSEQAFGQHVTIREMRTTLGEIMTIQIPSSAAVGNR